MADADLLPIEKARLAHLEAIAHHEHEIIRHKRELNKLAPISRLPIEILGTVFVYVAQDRPVVRVEYNWLWFSHTCFAWRQVALSAPRIWSHIHLTNNREFMHELFARSKQAPLHISTPRPFIGKDILNVVFEQIHRVHSLHFRLGAGFPGLGDPPSPLSAPELRRLELDGSGHSQQDLIFRENCSMPKLSHLEIRSHTITMSWSHSILQNSLTHLIHHGFAPQTDSWTTVLTVLARMSRLKVLELQHVLPSSPCPDTSSVVELPKLESLRIANETGIAMSFLRRVVLPSITLLSLDLTRASKDDFNSITDAIGARLRSVASADMDVYSVHMECSLMLWRVMAWTDKMGASDLIDAVDEDYPGSALCLDVTVRTTQAIVSGDRFPFICNVLPSSTVHALYLKLEHTSAPHDRALSSALPNVRELVINISIRDGGATSSIFHLIDVLPPAANNPKEVLFPNLEVLALINVKFRRSIDDVDDDDLVELLRKTLKKRMDEGCTVKELVLQDAINISEGDVDELNGVVGKVTWDPRRVMWESDEEESDSYDDLYDDPFYEGYYDDNFYDDPWGW